MASKIEVSSKNPDISRRRDSLKLLAPDLPLVLSLSCISRNQKAWTEVGDIIPRETSCHCGAARKVYGPS